jgi:uncharacterized protein YdeI (YjbR/CyaY-like superfamily)
MLTFFKTPAEFRAWLARHGAVESELVVGFYKRESGRPSMTWSESVDEALCFGWIDGVRTRIDEHSYKIRFSPRKPTSIWSAINVEKVRVLQAAGRMTKAGLDAFARRSEERSRAYSYEQTKRAVLEPAQEAKFKKNKKAWKFFEAQPPSYRRMAAWYVVSAKRPETRQTRLTKVIEASANGVRIRRRRRDLTNR